MIGITKTWPLLAVILVSLSACDVVKLDAEGHPILPQTAGAVEVIADMTPEQIAEKIWPQEILATARQSAQDWQQLQAAQLSLQAGQQLSHFFQLTGTVESIDRSRRDGVMVLQVGQQPVTVQIGPIVRGNAIRDAAPGISFDEFKNQVQFARLAKVLNKKALSGIQQPDDSWQGKTVNVLLAATVTPDDIKQAVPLALTMEGE